MALKVDPGQMLSKHGCGTTCSDDLSIMGEIIQQFMTESDLYHRASKKCLQYVKTYHDKEIIVSQYEEALISLIDSNL